MGARCCELNNCMGVPPLPGAGPRHPHARERPQRVGYVLATDHHRGPLPPSLLPRLLRMPLWLLLLLLMR